MHDRALVQTRSKIKPSMTYQYEKLSAGESLRLLILQASVDKEAPLKAELRRFWLEDVAGTYEALSYTWGSNNPTHEISIGSGYLNITTNLRNGLRQLRAARKSRILWIDAICINQGDDNERTAQVAIMYRIYSGALRTIVWLGDTQSDEEAASVFDFLRKVQPYCVARLERQRHSVHEDIDTILANVKLDNLETQIQAISKQQAAERRTCTTPAMVDRFLHCPWFTRRWVLQEVFVAQEVEVIWGRQHIPWIYLERALKTLLWASDDAVASAVQIATMGTHKSTWTALRGDCYRSNALQLMTRFSAFECKDARDRISALRGMFEGSHLLRAWHTIDYVKPVADNYLSFASALAQTGHCVGLLTCAAARSQGHPFEAEPGLPTWVPDWRLQPTPLSSEVAGVGGGLPALVVRPGFILLDVFMHDTVSMVRPGEAAGSWSCRIAIADTTRNLPRIVPTYSNTEVEALNCNVMSGDVVCSLAEDYPSSYFILRQVSAIFEQHMCGQPVNHYRLISECQNMREAIIAETAASNQLKKHIILV